MEHITNAVTICALVTSIASIVNIIAVLANKVKEPERTQNDRIVALETEVKEMQQHLDNDNQRFNQIEKGNHVTHEALLALLSHAINGNDEEALVQARDDLNKYLVTKE